MNKSYVGHFSFYLELLNIKMNNGVLILTTQYYYDLNEIKHISTIVHSKELNQVKDLQRLMSNLMRGLSNETKFVGCFVDDKIRHRGRVAHWLSHFVDMDDNRYISRKRMLKLFTKFGLQVVDMTEVDGMTYFCVKKS